MGQEAKLQNKLKHKEKISDDLKDEFEDKCGEQSNKHIAEIEEQNKREKILEENHQEHKLTVGRKRI